MIKYIYATKSKMTNRLRVVSDETTAEGGDVIIGEDEYLLIKRLREHKMTYQMDFEELKTLKSEVKYCEKLVEQSRHRLVQR